MSNIKELVSSLTSLPVLVLNSHTQYDHINGNYLFDSIAGISNNYSKANVKSMAHQAFLSFYKQAYLASDSQVQCIPAAYFIHSFFANKLVDDKIK